MLSDSDRATILTLFALTKRKACAAAFSGHSRATVRKVISNPQYKRKAAKKSAAVVKKEKLCCKLALKTKRVNGQTIPAYGSAPRIATALAAKGIRISARHVTRILGRNGLRAYKRPKAPTRALGDVKQRKAFGRLMLCTMNTHDYQRIIFSDEVWLSVNDFGVSVQYCARRDEVLPLERQARWNIPSIMCWACIGVGYRSPLVIFPRTMNNDDNDGSVSFRLNSESYIRRCLSRVVRQFAAEGRLFMQDGARPHTAARTMRYLTRSGVEVLTEWPQRSPDLNPIEFCWNDFKRHVAKYNPATPDQLIAAARRAWQDIPQQIIDKHVLSFERRLRDVVRKRG